MTGTVAAKLNLWLAEGRNDFGEVKIEQTGATFRLHHYLDSLENDLARYTDSEDALSISKFDCSGGYRPLRSAPSLQRGWELHLSTTEEVVRALEYFYPAMLGTAMAFEENAGQPVNLRESLNRQSGMYRVTQKISNDDADKVIGKICPPKKCLKTITWKIADIHPVLSLPASKTDFSDTIERAGGFIPLPCEECCNILIAAIREAVKKPGRALASNPP